MILSAVLLLAIAAAHALLLPPSLATVPTLASRSFSARMALNDGDAIDVEAVSSSDDDDGRSSPPQPSTRRTADTTAAENEFLQFAGGEQRAAQIVDELEATSKNKFTEPCTRKEVKRNPACVRKEINRRG